MKTTKQDVFYQTLFQQCGDIIIELDHEHKIVNLNKVARTSLGVSKVVALKSNLFNLCQQKGITLSFNAKSLKAALHSQTTFIEGYITNSDRQKRAILWKYVAFSYSDNKPSHYLLIGKDLDELISHKQGLASNRPHLKRIIENLPEYIYWKDRTLVYGGCNQHVAEYLGLQSPDEIVGKTDYDFGWSEDRIKVLHEMDMEILNTGISSVSEDIIPKPDNTQRIMLTSKSPLRNDRGDIIGILGVSTDITEHKRLEKLEIEKTKADYDRELAEEYAGYMKIMAGSIAHELRTPLASIRFAMAGIRRYLSVLLEAYQLATANELPVKKMRSVNYELLERVPASVERELSYANNVIDMLLMNTKYHDQLITEQTFNYISINKVLHEAVERFPFNIPKQKTLIHYNDPQQDFIFYGVDILAVHVVFNLLKNALHYIEAERKGEIFIWVEEDTEFNKLHFKDTASGIPEEIKKNLFKRFYSNRIGGTGIGLAFCKVVMQSFGGDIECYSVENQYTEFVLKFPKINPNLQAKADYELLQNS